MALYENMKNTEAKIWKESQKNNIGPKFGLAITLVFAKINLLREKNSVTQWGGTLEKRLAFQKFGEFLVSPNVNFGGN